MAGITWILVCDASRAHFYREETKGRFTALESLEHADSRARRQDLMADAPGRKPNGNPGGVANGTGSGGTGGGTYMGRPGAAPDTDPKEVEAQKFARELAERLEQGLNQHDFDGVVLVAPPQFLGLLKSTLSTQVAKHVVDTVDKDLSWLEGPQLKERLRDLRAA